ncbi:glutamate racemase [Nonlabens sp. Hel1_33_55]|uniref:glutamate racemase n=1 Tax=Nonlabens sp. Hel1_33_55 TaxID=1336802 RepID=UPI000B833FE3|nr:glutamate racemase [Nonlabens sp. Hel1_33_55]
MLSKAPIGFFDSGVGGTSVWKEVVQLLPHENTIYLADSRNAPYGIKSTQEIIELSIKNTEYLLQQGCKLIAVPCNTATTNAIDYLRANYKVPFIGIEPAIKPAALNSDTKKIGILATKGTLSSQLFKTTQEKFTRDIDTVEVTGTGIVELIESGKKDSDEMTQLLVEIINPLLSSGIDYLVLGCSHYPYIKENLQELLPNNVKIIDSGVAVARQTLAILQDSKLLNTSKEIGQHQLYSNANPTVLQELIGNMKNATVESLNF